jgi:hypothetical protein
VTTDAKLAPRSRIDLAAGWAQKALAAKNGGTLD